MRPETIEKLKRVEARIHNGERVEKACKAENMGTSHYYLVKRDIQKSAKKYKTTKAPKFIDVPLQSANTSSDKVTVIVCHTHQLKSLLEGLS